MSTINIKEDFLDSLFIQKLKNIHNLNLSFDKNKEITAIFGPNGCGKSTILHALACVYQQKKITTDIYRGEVYKFSDFFIPTTLGVWNESKLTITYSSESIEKRERVYEKKNKRWTRYEDRPRREVYFVGIDICVPKIEKEKKKSFIRINVDGEPGEKEKIIKDISYVMNRRYDSVLSCNEKKYRLATTGGISYPSLFMGAGENKIIELLKLFHSAGKGSLILIDELDLTLHTAALVRLLEKMIEIAREKGLQIIFTSHRDEILNLDQITSKIDVRHIFQISEGKTECLNKTTSKCVAQLTGRIPEKKVIYVEDSFSEEIVKRFLQTKGMLRYYDITIFGAIKNSFTIACGLYLSSRELFNKSYFVLDGDRYIKDEEKQAQIDKVYTGTEDGILENKRDILRHFFQYDSKVSSGEVTEYLNPEKFIHDAIITNGDPNSETYKVLEEICGVADDHQYIPPNYPWDVIIEDFSKLDSIWSQYTSDLNRIISESDEIMS